MNETDNEPMDGLYEVEVFVYYEGAANFTLDRAVRSLATASTGWSCPGDKRPRVLDVGSGYDFQKRRRDFQFWFSTKNLAELYVAALPKDRCTYEMKDIRQPADETG